MCSGMFFPRRNMDRSWVKLLQLCRKRSYDCDCQLCTSCILQKETYFWAVDFLQRLDVLFNDVLGQLCRS